MKIFLILLFLMPIFSAKADNSETLRIAVASNFITTARQLVTEYQKQTQQNIVISSGSTGKLTTQIRFGAPYDLFLSADLAHPQKLIAQQLAQADTLQAYAIGQLVLISRLPSVTPDTLPAMDKSLHIAIANPKIAPYGVAGSDWLQANLTNIKQHRVIMGENINQTWHYFVNGGADLALVALSQIKTQQALEFKYWLLETPAKQLRQFAVQLARTEQPDAVKRFLAFLESPSAQKIIETAGYRLPNAL